MIVICAILGAPALASQDTASDTEKAFHEANAMYATGNYEGAVKNLEWIISSGASSGNIYYNLGGAYFKTGKIGEAILNYERSRLLIPRDSDLLSNYEFVRSKMKQKDTSPKKNWIFASLDMAFSYLTYKELLGLVFVIYYIVFALIVLSIFIKGFRRSLRPIIIVTVVMLLVCVEPLHQKIVYIRQSGIVTASITDARFEPLSRAETNFPLYEGMKVNILTRRGEWLKIKRPDGKIGWVERSSVKPVIK